MSKIQMDSTLLRATISRHPQTHLKKSGLTMLFRLSLPLLLVASLLLTTACGPDDPDPRDPTEVTLGETTFVVVVNPTVNDINEPNMPAPGSERSGVTIEASSLSVQTGEEGVAVLGPVESGQVELEFRSQTIDAALTQTISNRDLVEVAAAVADDGAREMARVIYAFGGTVVEISPEDSSDDVSDALSGSNQIVLLSEGTYTGDLDLSGSEVTLFGAGATGGRVVIDGNVTISGSGNRIRGAHITGDLEVGGSTTGISFSTIDGDVEISGSDTVLLQNSFCGLISIGGSDTIALGNQGLAPLDADCE